MERTVAFTRLLTEAIRRRVLGERTIAGGSATSSAHSFGIRAQNSDQPETGLASPVTAAASLGAAEAAEACAAAAIVAPPKAAAIIKPARSRLLIVPMVRSPVTGRRMKVPLSAALNRTRTI
jgi:hypothetical protein